MSIDVHSLSGAYALDALTSEEAAEFELHLKGCETCRTEVREFREVLAAMGEQSWAAAPRGLREEVLAAAERTPQQPPAVRTVPTEPTEPTGPTEIASRRRLGPALLLAAAAAVVAAALGGLVGLRGADEDPRVEARPLPAAARTVFDAPDASQVALETANGGTLRVAVSATRQEMAVDTRDLPPLDDEHVYQLWSVHDGLMASAAVLGDDAAGAAMGMPSEGTQIAVTVEPGDGSKQPTGEPIATVDPASL